MKKLLKIIIASFIFRVFMEFIYVNFIHETYPEQYIVDRNNFNYCLSWIIFMVFLVVVSKMHVKKDNLKVSNVIIIVLFYISYIPTSIHFAFANLTYSYFLIFTLYWSIIFILNFLFLNSKKNNTLTFSSRKISVNLKNKLFNGLVILSMILILFTSFKSYGKIYIHFGLADVYDLRANASNMGMSVLYSLLLTWVGTVILPFSAIKFFYERKFIKFALMAFIQLVSFSIAGHKMQLFIIPFGLIAPHILKKENISYLPLCFSGLTLGAIIEKLILKTDFLCEYFVNRVFYIPSLLNYYYFDFFSHNVKNFFMEDLLIERLAVKFFDVSRPYPTDISEIIGQYYYGKPMHANNGMFAYGYADAGIVGVILAALILVLMLYILNWITYKYSVNYTAIIIVTFSIAFISVSLSSLFYSNLIPLIIVKLLYEGETGKLENNQLLS